MQRVTFTSAVGETVELYLSPFFLNKIEGLGDVESETQTQRAPEQDGSTPVYTTLEERAIPMEVVILENLLQNRQLFSRVFNPKLGPGTLTYDNGLYVRKIKAQSEHVPTFPDNRPRKTQTVLIDLICHDPYWKEINDMRTDIAVWEPMFEFPLVIDQTDGVELGRRTPAQIVNVRNDGHTETGMIIEFRATTTVTNPQLVHVETLQFLKIKRVLQVGEVVKVDTNKGSKTVTSHLNGVTTNIINDLVFGSKFFQLQLGDNLFRYDADANEDFLEVGINHTNKFVGV